jgi:hypothetical protein
VRLPFASSFVVAIALLTIASCVPQHRSGPARPAVTSPDDPDRGPFRLLVVSPQGEVARPEEARIALVFSRPIAGTAAPAAVVRSHDASAVDGTWIWVGEDTAVFEPKNLLTDGTRFRVTVDPSLRARDGSTLQENGLRSTFDFSTARPTLVATRYLGWDVSERRAKVELQYSLPVRPEVVRQTLQFEGKGAGGLETVAFDVSGQDATSLPIAELDP